MLKTNQLLLRGAALAGLCLAWITAAWALPADDYTRNRGNNPSLGRIDGAPDGPGRSFLRWWDPIISIERQIDNFETAASFTPPAGWFTPGGPVEAANAIDFTPGQPAYRYARTVNSPSEGQFYLPDTGRILRSFTWSFAPVTVGGEYQISVNIPIGPTTVGTELLFQQRYFVYEIEGVVNLAQPGQPVRMIIDTFTRGGGWVRLNEGGSLTDTLWVADGTGQIRVRLLNTIPRDGQNQLTAIEDQTLVYADAARIVQGVTQSGTMTAQPIVGTLTGPDLYPVRVMVPRNESNTLQVGTEIRTYQMGVLSSFDHNGTNINPSDDGTGRRNLVWSWPVLRPQNVSTAEIDRYGLEKRDFIRGAGTLWPAFDRSKQNIDVDNLQGSVTVTGGWSTGLATAANRGLDFLTIPSGTVGGYVDFEPVLTDGDYEIYAWIPNNVAGLATRQRFEIYEGTVPGVGGASAVVDVDMSTAPAGWFRLTSNAPFPRSLFASNGFGLNQPLAVRVTAEGSTGGVVYADAIRFVRQSDLRMTSTAVFSNVRIRPPGSGSVQDRDVVFVATESGRLYALDARGDAATGRTTVYWAYPSERTNDPNHVTAEDGPNGGVAENPIAFDTSSALIKRVGGEDVLYIGARNGKVYAINIDGRGDGSASAYGTTTRRWTYPDDFDPSSILPISTQRLGPFVGSLSSADSSGTTPIIVPTTEGRIYALDPDGSAATKTTSVVWRYPAASDPTLPPIAMTPLVSGNRVIFGTGNRVYWLNATTGAEVLNVLVPGVVFGQSSPTLALDTELNGDPTSVYIASDLWVHSFNFATGAEQWRTNEIAAAGGGLSFTQATAFNSSGDLIVDMPVVVVPTIDGGVTMLGADTVNLNAVGVIEPVPAGVEDRNRRVWEYRLEGQATEAANLAIGARITGETYRWMYSVDDLGYLYAFNYDPSRPLDQQTITAGERPGEDVLVENNPQFTALDAIAANARVAWLTPEDYESLVLQLRNGTITYASVLAAVGSPEKVTRQNFDYGETIYFVIYNLPFLAGPNPRPYYMEVQLNTPGTVTQRRNIAMQLMAAEANDSRKIIGLSSFPLVGNGANPLAPGQGSMTTRAVFTGVQSGQPGGGFANRPLSGTNGNRPLRLANPLGIGDINGANPVTDIGRSIDPANTEVLNNGNFIGAVTPTYKNILRAMGPDFSAPGDPVPHGQASYARFQLIDRSLMRLVFGNTVGLQNIRFAIADMAFRRAPYIDDAPADGLDDSAPNGISDGWGTFKFLDPTVYSNYEDLPENQPNISLDYPDLRREGFRLTRELDGSVENPLFGPIALNPPTVDSADLANYRGLGYNTTLNRTLVPTVMEAQMNVPRYQPPSRYGYRGRQVVYVDSDQPGRQLAGNLYRESYRDLDLGMNIGIDERIVVDTPVLDLGSLAAGSGQGAGVGENGAPLAFRSWNPSSPFSPWTPAPGQPDFKSFFQPINVRNEGNVNLLNVRLAKRDARQGPGRQTIALQAPGLSPLTWLDATQYLHANFDSRFAPVVPGTGANRVVVQKPRPGDGIGTAMNVNPKTRSNANLAEPGGRPLFALTTISETDGQPRVGVTIPIGAPSGAYSTQLTVIEDRSIFATLPEMIRADDPAALGFPGAVDPNVLIPYAEPGFNLRFNVRETRLTNRNTRRAAPMVETRVNGTESFFWSNQQPTALRDGAGNVVMAFSSNRVDAGGVPGWNFAPRTEANTAQTDQWRIYLSRLRQGTGLSAGVGQVESSLIDLFNLTPDTGGRWWSNEGIGYPSAAPGVLFPTSAVGETVEPNSMQFYNPTFPASGAFNLLDTVTDAGRNAQTNVYMAFNGEAIIRRPGTEPRREYRIFLTQADLSSGVSLAGVPEQIAFDPESPKSRPSVVQAGNIATVFYTVTSGGQGQIVWNTYNGSNFNQTQTLGLSNAFETVGAPAAVLRRYRNGINLANNNQIGRIDLLFTAKMRGRLQSEAYLARLSTNINGVPVNRFGQPGGGGVLFNPTRFDNLTVDPGTGLYWTPGSEWRLNQGAADLAGVVSGIDVLTNADLTPLNSRFNASDSYIDLYLVVNGVRRTILDHTTRRLDAASGLLTFDSTLGGKVYLDSRSGTVRFSGGIIPRNGQLQVRYTPKYLRISAGPSANYRGASVVFDDRFIGEFGYWATPSGGAINSTDLVRNDRWFFAFTRTSPDGGSVSRPYYSTMRFGIQLPTSILTDADGRLLDGGGNLTVTVSGMPGGSFYQVDPVNGKIYFTAENEDRTVTVSWRGVDANGVPLSGTFTRSFTIGMIPETVETAVPIEQATNEGSISLALDPLNGAFNRSNYRRPGLVWVFWTSTRAGSPDLFFQTLAPRFTPIPPGG